MADLETRVTVLEKTSATHETRINDHSKRMGAVEVNCAGHKPVLDNIQKALEIMAVDIRELKAVPGKRYETIVTQVVIGIVIIVATIYLNK